MSTEIVRFEFNGRAVRTVVIDGAAWFVVTDVAGILGYRDATNAGRLLRPAQQGYSEVSTPGGTQRMLVTNESGLNRLILRSNRPEAEEIQEWVEDEVLPSIRETGSYGASQLPDMSTPEGQLQVAELLAAGARKQIEQAAEIKVLKPKAEYVDAYVDGVADATILRIVAKQNQVGEKWLRQLLTDRKIIARRIVGTRWSHSKRRNETQYEWYARRGYESWFVQRDQPEAPRLHNGQMQTTLYVTPVGKVQVSALIAREGEAS